MDHHPLDDKAASIACCVLPLAYAALMVQYPHLWAAGMLTLFVIASGVFTTRVLIGFEKTWQIVGLCPVFGGMWLMLGWLVYRLG